MLDQYQRAVVEAVCEGGDLRISAGAGAGKTRTLVESIAALVERRIAEPGQIAAISFTRKAADELKSRLAERLGARANGLTAGTFHSRAVTLGALQARDPARWDMARCIDTAGWGAKVSKPLLWSRIIGYGTVPGTRRKGLDIDLGESPIGWRDYDTATGALRSWGLTSQTAQMAEGDALSMRLAATHELPSLITAWRIYEEAIAALGVFDFSGILEGYYGLLCSGDYTPAYKWVFVDEAQDNSWLQLAIARGMGGNLVLLGDGRQSIYSWRGAAPSIFAGFEGSRLDLPTNYRSKPAIVRVGNAICHGEPWHDGDVQAHQTAPGGVEVLEAESRAHRIADALVEAHAGGTEWGEMAILCRSSAAFADLEIVLAEYKIPALVVGASFWGSKLAQDVCAYVALCYQDHDAALERVCNRPKRYLGRKFVEGFQSARGNGADFMKSILKQDTSRGWRKSGARVLADDIAHLRRLDWPAQIRQICDYFRPDSEETSAQHDQSKALDRILALAGGADSPRSFIAQVQRAARSTQEAKTPSEADRVVISTIHRAKGLEWHTVVVCADAEELPHPRSSDLDEERRLAYVAVTRAAAQLVIAPAENGLTSLLDDAIGGEL